MCADLDSSIESHFREFVGHKIGARDSANEWESSFPLDVTGLLLNTSSVPTVLVLKL